MTGANVAKLTSLHFYAWKAGLKTGMYYLRTKAATDAIKFTIDPKLMKEMADKKSMEEITCSLSNPEACEACSS